MTFLARVRPDNEGKKDHFEQIQINNSQRQKQKRDSGEPFQNSKGATDRDQERKLNELYNLKDSDRYFTHLF